MAEIITIFHAGENSQRWMGGYLPTSHIPTGEFQLADQYGILLQLQAITDTSCHSRVSLAC